MTMVIERMSIVWEERRPAEAIREGIGSLIVSALAYLVMSIPSLGHLVFVFPELLLILLAASLLLGRYTGYRLLELFRFKALAGSEHATVFSFWHKLRAQGVLGMSSRNSDFIVRYNQRSLYPLVDDKLQTKKLAVDAGMAIPELYGVISSPHDIRHLPEILKGRTRFVIKPANGSGGDGIIVVKGVQNGGYQKYSGQLLDQEEIDYHMSSTLSGLYSLGGQIR